uniref:Uncharacterized protein n=1 Tax=Eucampia antarctica TaxID=49252 RepID=A0A7S2R3J9_9STRA|mmetsp:Transcript_15639/g.15037  ORF Transcript_15639/g.15037 Transcript_15639/m.15037 type:complete len:408 (+) Transcript_15639:98-1321(+)|eukprot:CAMPEP_0197827298 /NCGR_PEP_ID=MMETSP1437-20131217/4107_1 /TAXON_ID=49252 ORGANISM="Eucampia antarctica, Strain CCMP1452" /NCGR_SAMPLE_ID=MMETSP1437 /ASSEMBLY_ACC=CAM_ASM_001096 /LENGTH=407 /DNA_ID=CAMNT_0043428093 /DNA_START=98 /DNA_END=1321 /DNA_ORIENTATION=-
MKLWLSSVAVGSLVGTGVSGFGIVSPSVSASVSASCARSSRCSLSMVTSGPMSCRPIGIGSAAPKTIISNVDLENVVETSDEWIQSRTGISQRHVLISGSNNDEEDNEEVESIRTLGRDAAKGALEMSKLSPLDIDLVIVATSSADDLFGDATSVAAALGCTNAVAFDLTAACSGFLFATVTAGQFLSNSGNSYKNAIVVGADALSRWIDWEDRNSCILFGDGAGAMVLTADHKQNNNSDSDDEVGEEQFGILGSSTHSNGLSYKFLKCEYEGSDVVVNTPDPVTLSKGSYTYLNMDGTQVYKFATREVPKVIKEALDAADMEVEDVDWLLLHQANIRIMEVVANRLKIPMDKVITNLADYGNTSAASIPLALDEAVRSGKVKKGDVIACAGFGAGLSWGSAILKWG